MMKVVLRGKVRTKVKRIKLWRVEHRVIGIEGAFLACVVDIQNAFLYIRVAVERKSQAVSSCTCPGKSDCSTLVSYQIKPKYDD